MKSIVVSILVAVAMIKSMVKPGEAAVTCGQVDSSLASSIPCLTVEASPAAACCGSVKDLKAITTTVDDRRVACDCVKSATARYPNIKEDAASCLREKCRAQMTISISKTTYCANIN